MSSRNSDHISRAVVLTGNTVMATYYRCLNLIIQKKLTVTDNYKYTVIEHMNCKERKQYVKKS
jgi:hypothetical protein